MQFMGVVKRVVPFILTFAAGLFIASFFVTVAAPNLNLRTHRSHGYYREMRQIRMENRELRQTNCRLRKENAELRRKALRWGSDLNVPPVEFEVPPPPPPPIAPRYSFER